MRRRFLLVLALPLLAGASWFGSEDEPPAFDPILAANGNRPSTTAPPRGRHHTEQEDRAVAAQDARAAAAAAAAEQDAPTDDAALETTEYTDHEPSDIKAPIHHADTVKANVTEKIGFQILRAAGDGNLEELQRLVAENGPNSLLFRDNADMFPLLEAGFNGRKEVAAWLIDKQKISVHTAGGHKFQALHAAAFYGHRSTCHTLLKRGAKLWAKTSGGQHPSDLAHQEGHKSLADWLDSWHSRNSMTGKAREL